MTTDLSTGTEWSGVPEVFIHITIAALQRQADNMLLQRELLQQKHQYSWHHWRLSGSNQQCQVKADRIAAHTPAPERFSPGLCVHVNTVSTQSPSS